MSQMGMGIVYVARLKQYDVAAVDVSAIREVRFVAKRLVRWFKSDRLVMMSDRKRHSSRKSKNKEITSRPNCRGQMQLRSMDRLGAGQENAR